MHPFRFALTRGPMIARAPETDEGLDPDLELDDELDVDEDPDEDEQDEDEPVEDDLDEQPDEPVRQPTRGENRVAAATKKAAEALTRAETLERELNALKAAQAQNNQPKQETPAELQARLAQMEPWERTAEIQRLDAQYLLQRQQKLEWDIWEQGDKAAYAAFAASKPIAAKLQADVEKALMAERAAGRYPDRQAVLKYLIGERALNNETRATNRTKNAAEGRRSAQAARPASGRGDVAASDDRRSSSAAARNKRLADIIL